MAHCFSHLELPLKSPIKSKPLRNPGESLDRQLQDVLDNEILLYLMVVAASIALVAQEWYRSIFKVPPYPWTMTIISISVSILMAVKIRKGIHKAKKIKQGLQGEKEVGQYLEQLREVGAKIFHDVPGPNFNLDHVIIHSSGIYVIETKTLSKPDRGETKLFYNGQTISKSRKELERDPITQVRAASTWLKGLLKDSTGKSFRTRPVVLFPGWYIETAREAKGGDLWVLNPKALPKFISNEKKQLTPEDVSFISFHLDRYIRSEK